MISTICTNRGFHEYQIPEKTACFVSLFLFSRAQGELDVARHRLDALSREKAEVAVGASAKIEELEAKVLEGEVQRRKMHNLIQVSYLLYNSWLC